MKLKQLLTIVISLIAFASHAQSESITPKYGVVDIDSILISLPETKVIYQKIDSIQVEANRAAEPIVVQLQEKDNQYRELAFSGDTLAINNLKADAEILYQELNLIQQKARRNISGYQQEMTKIYENIKSAISKVGEKLHLTFVIGKEEHPIYTSLGMPLYLESPLYYSGEAIDITGDVLKDVLPPKEPARSATSTKPKTNKSK